MTIKQKLCEKFNTHEWVIDQKAMKDLENDHNKRDIYKVYICAKCGMRREIKNDKRYFLV